MNKKVLVCLYANNAYDSLYEFCARLIKMCADDVNVSYDICVAINKTDNGYNTLMNLFTLIPKRYQNVPQIFITGFEDNYNICDFFEHSFLENDKFNLMDYSYVWCVNGASYFKTIDKEKTNILQVLMNTELDSEFDGFNIDEYFINDLQAACGATNHPSDKCIIFQNMLSKYILKPQSFKLLLQNIIQIFKDIDIKNFNIKTNNYFIQILQNLIYELKKLRLKKMSRIDDNVNMILDTCLNSNDILNMLLKLAITSTTTTPDEEQAVFDLLHESPYFHMSNDRINLWSYFLMMFVNGKISISNILREKANKNINTIKFEDDFVDIFINSGNKWCTIMLYLDIESYCFITAHAPENREHNVELFYD